MYIVYSCEEFDFNARWKQVYWMFTQLYRINQFNYFLQYLGLQFA